MKKVININFQGTIVPIEESSYELLQQYIESLRQYFANEEGKDEIINDIESRISELFQARLKAGSTCITDDDVNAIIKSMGRPADFEEEENGDKESGAKSAKSEKTESPFNKDWNWKSKRLYRDENHKILGGVCSGLAAYLGIDPVIVRVLFIVTGIGFFAYIILWIFVPGSNELDNGARKRLYRNPDGKILGGVCNGMASYFNVNVWIPRIIFLIPFISFVFRWGSWGPWSFPHFWSFSFSPSTLLIYVILWLVIPEANSTSEKLEMKGEKVDLNSIKNSVIQEMKGVGERVGKLGAEAGEFARQKGPEIGAEFGHAMHRSGGALGNVITTLFKIFVYLILGCIAFALIIALFAIAIVAIGLFPLKDFVLTDGWQTIFAWSSLIFFIGIPVVGIITFIIRRIAKVKSSNKLMRYSFGGLWIVGIVSFVLLVSSVGRDFKGISSMNDQKITLTNPTVKNLEVKSIQNINIRRSGWFNLEPYSSFGITNDTAFIGNVKIRIKQSPNDSFQVSVMKTANGNMRRYADTLASLIQFNVSQSDSVLWMDRAIAVNTTDKFRNQNVEVTIWVPVGHTIIIDKSFNYGNRVRIDGYWYNQMWNDDEDSDFDFKYGVQYIMNKNGLYTMDGKPSSNWSNDSNNDEDVSTDDNNKVSTPQKFDSLKSVQEQQILKMERSVDSAKQAQKESINKLKDSLKKVKDEINKKIEKLDKGTAEVHSEDVEEPNFKYSFMMDI
jgi:phage shock protein PspC (stress-responsive transcriptional regulator)